MERRPFLKVGSSAALGLAMGGCDGRENPVAVPRLAARRRVKTLQGTGTSGDAASTAGKGPHTPDANYIDAGSTGRM
jgi:hypothetical protein